MIKSGLKVYRDNIYEVFAIIGIIAIGILIGFLIVLPSIDSLIRNNIGKVASAASSVVGEGFKTDTFFVKFANSLNNLSWGNPFKELKFLFKEGGLLKIIKESLLAAGLHADKFVLVEDSVMKCISSTLNGLTNQAAIFIACVGVFGLLAYVLTRLFIKIRSTNNANVLRFMLSLLSNCVLLLITFTIVGLCLYYLNGPVLYVVIILSLIAMLIISLIVSILIYKNKDTKFSELFNIKTLLLLFLSCLIVLSISFVLIIPVLIFSELIGLLIAIPLLIVTNIIIENIAINYITEFDKRKRMKVVK